jgi:hypothetical protein
MDNIDEKAVAETSGILDNTVTVFYMGLRLRSESVSGFPEQCITLDSIHDADHLYHLVYPSSKSSPEEKIPAICHQFHINDISDVQNDVSFSSAYHQ